MAINRPSSGPSRAKVGIVGSLAAFTGLWVGAEPAARFIIGSPTMPPPPELVLPKPERRSPIKAVVGFDTTRSKMMHDLPGVVAATREFFKSTKVLEDGDKVEICTFAEGATPGEHGGCNEFTFPGQKAELLDRIRAVRVEGPRPGMKTYVHHSLSQLVEQVDHSNPGVVVGWTDAIEDDRAPNKSPLPGVHAPLKIVVPRSEYVRGAEEVKRGLGDSGVEVVVASTSRQFGKFLEDVTGELNAEAARIAQRKAKSANQAARAKHAKDMYEWNQAVETSEEKKAEVEARIQSVKKGIKITAASLLGLALAGFGMVEWMRRRPRTYGWIVDARGTYQTSYQVPSSTKPLSLNAVAPGLPAGIQFSPIRGGMSIRGNILSNGQSIADKIYWFANQPTQAELAKLTPKKPVTKDDDDDSLDL